MRLVTFCTRALDGQRFGIGLDGGVVDLATFDTIHDLPATLEAYLNGDQRLRDTVRRVGETILGSPSIHESPSFFEYGSIEFLPPVTRPGKILAAARNYEDHRIEAGAAGLSTNPEVDTSVPTGFIKASSTLIGHLQPIIVPDWIEDVDYESELVLVIGTRADDVAERDSLDYLAGFSVGNDVSARRLQQSEHRSGGGPVVGKNPKTFGPLGPWLVTPDEIEDPMCQRVWCKVNGEIRQDALTSDMRFDIRALISWYSKIGLDPGDMIFTGTPSGIGAAGRGFLGPGDVVTCGVDGVGELENPVTRGGWSK